MSNSKNPKDPKNQENKGTKDTEEKQSKIVTKYDRKVERRKEQKAKEERDKKISRITGIVLAAALVCFVASFPIRTYLTALISPWTARASAGWSSIIIIILPSAIT